MTNEIKTGGPAFPQPMLDTKGGSGIVVSEEMDFGGMTLRDYFAAKALNGYLSAMDTGWSFDELADACYEMADAMIAAREKGGAA